MSGSLEQYSLRPNHIKEKHPEQAGAKQQKVKKVEDLKGTTQRERRLKSNKLVRVES
jgi:hypothetical protein